MLESRSLLLLRWEEYPAGADLPLKGRRYFVNPESEAPVGFVAEQGRTWLRQITTWMTGSASYEIHETEDESLLFSYHPRVVPGNEWRILDADDELVGWLRPRSRSDLAAHASSKPADNVWILTAVHSPYRVLSVEPIAERTVILRMYAQGETDRFPTEVGTVAQAESGLVINFLPGLDQDPFAKMLLVAAVLVAFPE